MDSLGQNGSLNNENLNNLNLVVEDYIKTYKDT